MHSCRGEVKFAPAKIEAMEAHIETVMNRTSNDSDLDEDRTICTSNDSDLDEDRTICTSNDSDLDVDVVNYINPPQAVETTEFQPATVIDRGTSPEYLEPNSDRFDAEVAPTDYGDMPQRGAVAVFAAMLVMVVVAIRSILVGGCAIVRGAVLFASMFGRYNSDLDIWYRLRSKHYALAA